MKDCKSGIYCIENLINNKKYIGQSKNINDRWKKHIYDLNNRNHDNDYLQKSWNKYGQINFKFYVLEYCNADDLDSKECYYIDLYNTLNRNLGYNLKYGGQNGGSLLSEYSRKKLSESIKKSYTKDLIERRRKTAIENWKNPEIRKKYSGENNGMYGKKHSEESKRKMSENHRGSKAWNKNLKQVFCVEINKIFTNATEASNTLSLDSGGILKVCRGERKTCGGYHWKFIEE